MWNEPKKCWNEIIHDVKWNCFGRENNSNSVWQKSNFSLDFQAMTKSMIVIVFWHLKECNLSEHSIARLWDMLMLYNKSLDWHTHRFCLYLTNALIYRYCVLPSNHIYSVKALKRALQRMRQESKTRKSKKRRILVPYVNKNNVVRCLCVCPIQTMKSVK